MSNEAVIGYKDLKKQITDTVRQCIDEFDVPVGFSIVIDFSTPQDTEKNRVYQIGVRRYNSPIQGEEKISEVIQVSKLGEQTGKDGLICELHCECITDHCSCIMDHYEEYLLFFSNLDLIKNKFLNVKKTKYENKIKELQKCVIKTKSKFEEQEPVPRVTIF